MTRGQRTRVAAYALVTDAAGRVLLCRIAPLIAPGEIWTLPGGGLEFGEAPKIAVLRELSEEAGYQGEIIELADVADRVLSDGGRGGRMHAIRIIYRVRIVGGEPRDEIDGSTDMCRWFSRDEALRLNLGSLAHHALTLLEDLRTARPEDDRSVSPTDSSPGT